jgi:vitamin B12 transporter
VRLRGSEANHVLVLIDGIKVSDPFQGEYDFAGLVADPGVRLEVLRGQQSSLYGSDAIGGIIQMVTLSGAEAPGVALRAEGGSFGTVNGNGRVAGVAGALDYAVAGGWLHSQGAPTAIGGRRDIGSDIGSISARLALRASPTVSLRAVVRYSHTGADQNDFEGDASRPSFGHLVDSPGTHFTNNALYALAGADLSLADGRWLSRVEAQFADVQRRGYAEDVATSGDKGRRWRGSATTSYRIGAGRFSHRFTFALDAERERYRNLGPAPFAFTGWRDADTIGLVGQYELEAGGLALGASARQDFNNRFDDATSWRVQAGQAVGAGFRLHGAYGTAVKNPGFYELFGYSDGRYIGNPDLRPEKSQGWEAGIGRHAGPATIDVTWFDSRLKDEIAVAYLAPDFTARPYNRGDRSKQQGIEATLALRPHPQLALDAAYTWTRARERDSAEVRRPAHVASLNTTVSSVDQRFSTTFTLRYTGSQIDFAYTDPSYVPLRVRLADYVLVNWAARYRLTDRLALFGRAENLLGEHYSEIFSYQAAGRAFHGGLSLRL